MNVDCRNVVGGYKAREGDDEKGGGLHGEVEG